MNIAAVSRLTGVSSMRLRKWEERYGVPAPARTAKGHRTYSDADVHTVLWLRDRLDEGYRIREAARLLGDGRLPPTCPDGPLSPRRAGATLDGMPVPSSILVSLGPELRRLDRAAALAPELDEATLRPVIAATRDALDELAREVENLTAAVEAGGS